MKNYFWKLYVNSIQIASFKDYIAAVKFAELSGLRQFKIVCA